VLHELKHYEAALESLDKALLLRPNYAYAHANRGNVYPSLKRHDEARKSFETASSLDPAVAEFRLGLAEALAALNEHHRALECCDDALVLREDFAEAHFARGNALQALGRTEDALESYARSVALKPAYAEAHFNWGIALRTLNRHHEALQRIDKAFALEPRRDFFLGAWLSAKMTICDWKGVDGFIEKLSIAIDRGERAAEPFAVLGLLGAPALQRKAAEAFVRAKYSTPLESFPSPRPRSSPHKVRIGYFSADFRDHPIGYLIRELFRAHSRDHFHVTAFSFGPSRVDEVRDSVAAAVDRFINIRDTDDVAVVKLSRELGIDIAVDLMGFTRGSRPGLFARRVAPVQVNYLGYPGTSAAAFMDYIIADRTVIRAADRRHYSEKIVFLPDCYWVDHSKRQTSERAVTREECGLPAAGFVFCNFNNNHKILPETFDVWMRILQRTDGSVLWLLRDSEMVAPNLRMEAAARGVPPHRLVFAERVPRADHQARHGLAGLFLDTLPYGAHTTASDALWGGVPVLTRMGESFAGRVASSMLAALDLRELITTSKSDYEDVAVELALDCDRLSAIRRKLEAARLTKPLFDTLRFARNIEAAFSQIHERYCRGESPQDVIVS
jgi:predicted O-linked N-acetylglucosamine transferase (SPINDLY family)